MRKSLLILTLGWIALTVGCQNEVAIESKVPVTQASVPDPFPHVGDSDFASKVGPDSGLVLVDFYADWCGPCKMQASVLQQLGPVDGLSIIKVDTDHSPKLSKEFNITGIPHLILFKDGQKVAEHTGLLSQDQLKSFIQTQP